MWNLSIWQAVGQPYPESLRKSPRLKGPSFPPLVCADISQMQSPSAVFWSLRLPRQDLRARGKRQHGLVLQMGSGDDKHRAWISLYTGNVLMPDR